MAMRGTRKVANDDLDTSAGRALIQEGIRELKRMVRQGGDGNLPDHWEQRLRLYQSATDLGD
jgi:hypothetical protein